MFRSLIAISVLSILSSVVLGQQAPPNPRVPQIVIHDGPGQGILGVSQAKADVLIDGYLAETTMTLTFSNRANRVLEGELVFPLPEGATVSGYGLDVNGTIVDGVAVEKQRARIIYETEVHKGIDPGLLEHVSGNAFRTRIYPIPANGSRTVRVRYVSELAQDQNNVVYTLPINWTDPAAGCTVRIEAIHTGDVPTVRGEAFKDLHFARAGDRFVGEHTFVGVKTGQDLAVALPAPNQSVTVELKPTDVPQGVDHYFIINDPAPAAGEAMLARQPRRIGILWDASMSREGTDKARELALLKSVLANAGDVDVDLFLFSNEVQAPRTFAIHGGNADELTQTLKRCVYDGGTNFGQVRMARNLALLVPGANAVADYGYWLVFTDGNGNLGDPMPGLAEVPAYLVSNDDRANHPVLRYLAQQSGGAYINLRQMTDPQAIGSTGKPVFSFLRAEYQKDQVAEVYPAGGRQVGGRLTLAGKLLAPQATITLDYGYGSTVTQTRTFVVRQADAIDHGLVARQWAQMKVADLSIFPEKNHDALLQVGKAFNLVTPATSLLVLETVEQYVQYSVVPPKSRPEVYAAYARMIEQRRVEEKQSQEQRIGQVLAMWTERTSWYDQKHDYAADFKYVAPPVASPAPGIVGQFGAARGGGGALRHLSVTRNSAANSRSDTPAPHDEARRLVDDSPEHRPVMHPTAGDGDGVAAAAPTAALPASPVPDFTNAPQFSLDAARTDVRVLREGNKDLGGEQQALQLAPAQINITAWDPQTPYLKAIKAAAPEKAYDEFLSQRKSFGKSPAFYLDCADFFLRANQREVGIRILTDIAELELADARLLRIVAHRLNQLGEREAAIDLFQKILDLRPEEPQSHRDLALAIADRGDDRSKDARQMSLSALADYAESLRLLNIVITGQWARFQGIQVIAVEEANRIIARIKSLPGGNDVAIPLDSRLVRNLDLDLRVVMTWDTDNTDVDLWVTEPTGEKCFYQHNRTTIGGLLSTDFTDGYGPEEYCLRKQMPGTYKIEANFFGSRQQSLSGPTTVHATVITNFGRPNETRQQLTLRLTENKEVVEVGKVTLGDAR
jgi:tetratricopeptide (TPR) repeat protein